MYTSYIQIHFICPTHASCLGLSQLEVKWVTNKPEYDFRSCFLKCAEQQFIFTNHGNKNELCAKLSVHSCDNLPCYDLLYTNLTNSINVIQKY